MQYKVMCEITFPALDTVMDINLPINKTIEYICKMLDQIIVENISSTYKPKETSILIDKKTGKIYDKNKILKSTEINNGSKLVYY